MLINYFLYYLLDNEIYLTFFNLVLKFSYISKIKMNIFYYLFVYLKRINLLKIYLTKIQLIFSN